MQPTKRSNFAVSWEQIGDENENEDTYVLSTVHTLQGSLIISCKQKKKKKRILQFQIISKSYVCEVLEITGVSIG